MKGRGTGRYRPGERIKSFDEVKAGMLLIERNRFFDALNLIRVMSLDDTGLNRRIFYWQFVEPRTERLLGGEREWHAMWCHDFEGESAPSELSLALITNKPTTRHLGKSAGQEC